MSSEKVFVREVVLVGGGHTHVQVLRKLAMEPIKETHVTVVVDIPVAVYSGMVPGFVAGQYRADELEIDVVPLARRARASVVLAPATGVDPVERLIFVEGRPPIRYDVASFDIGSTVAGLDLPGIREHAIPTRPIGRFVKRVDEIVARAESIRDRAFEVVVVGAGSGGVELAFTLRERLRTVAPALRIRLLHSGARILPGYPDRFVRRIEARAEQDGIEIRCGVRAASASEGHVTLTSGETITADALIWVTGAVSHPPFRESGLATDDRGFVFIRSTLQVEGHDDLFAVGDCATLRDYPKTAKAGVYAVRQGPALTENLRLRLAGRALRPYHPQGDFLMLLNMGDGTAVGSKSGFAGEGRYVFRLKDWIDRRFMRKFQVLQKGGGLTEAFANEPEMGGGEMLCGGCAAKVGQPVLTRSLDRVGLTSTDPDVVLGLDTPDDAAAYRTPGGDIVVTSHDAFRAFTDDPYLVGRVTVVNACSDILAKGVAPKFALAHVAIPSAATPDAAGEILFQVMSGARDALAEEGVTLIGGHTTTATELIVGFTVDGIVGSADDILAIGGLVGGQALILTKPLGTGVVFNADMQGHAAGPWIVAALRSMSRSNRAASQLMREANATAATDVTGFGLVGHLGEMLRASGKSAVLDLAAIPALPGAVTLIRQGVRSTFHEENAHARRGISISPTAATNPKLELLFDPQTSGGLLIGVPAGEAEAFVERLRDRGDPEASVIGSVTDRRDDGALIRVEGE